MGNKKDGLPRYKGIILQHCLRSNLVDEILKGQIYEYNMELAKNIKIALDKYAKNALKLSAAVRKTRKPKPKLGDI